MENFRKDCIIIIISLLLPINMSIHIILYLTGHLDNLESYDHLQNK